MNTIPKSVGDGRHRRRMHSDEFKASVVASCLQPGISMASVAMANGLNANLLRRWVHEAEMPCAAGRPQALPAPEPVARPTAAAFVPVQLPAAAAAPDIRIELRRGSTAITVTWPTQAASEFATWMRELLR